VSRRVMLLGFALHCNVLHCACSALYCPVLLCTAVRNTYSICQWDGRVHDLACRMWCFLVRSLTPAASSLPSPVLLARCSGLRV
jgi:hypothetical protein